MQDRSSIISCFLVLFLFCFYQKKIQNFRRSLIKSQVCGLESEACLQLSRSRLNHLHCQLEAFGSWPELPKNVFFFLILFLSARLSQWVHLQNPMKTNPFYANLPEAAGLCLVTRAVVRAVEGQVVISPRPGLAKVLPTTQWWKEGSNGPLKAKLHQTRLG